jgi:adenylate cyclase
LDLYGLGDLARGDDAADRVDALCGLLPAVDAFCLPAVEVAPGRYADVHLWADGEDSWVLLVDRTAEVERRRTAQQLANDMSLLRDELDRRARPATGSLASAIPRAADRRRAAILTAVFPGLAEHAEHVEAADLLRDASAYARAVLRPVLDEAGAALGLAGDRLTAVFGLRPTTGHPAHLAVVAALRALDAVAELDASRRSDGMPAFGVRLGVASGEAVFGVLAGHAHVPLGGLGAAHIRSGRLAEAGDALRVDAETRSSAGDLEHRFAPDGADFVLKTS